MPSLKWNSGRTKSTRPDDPCVQFLKHLRQIAAQQRSRVEPQSGEKLAAQHTVIIGFQLLVTAIAENKPVDLSIENAPYHVFQPGQKLADNPASSRCAVPLRWAKTASS